MEHCSISGVETAEPTNRGATTMVECTFVAAAGEETIHAWCCPMLLVECFRSPFAPIQAVRALN